MQDNAKSSKNDKKSAQKKEAIRTIAVIAIIFLGTFGSYYVMKAALGTTMPMVVVTSPSMVPEINTGDLLFVKYVEPSEIKNGTHEDRLGDVIIFDSNGVWPNPRADPIVHRVVGKRYDPIDEKYYFITHGDANDYPDPPETMSAVEVPEEKVIGVVIGKIPAIGYIKIWLTDSGLAVPIMIFLGFLLVISIVYDITHPEEEDDVKKDKGRKKASKNIDIDDIDLSDEKETFDNKKIDFGV